MTETFLFLNGQPVILTSDSTDTLTASTAADSELSGRKRISESFTRTLSDFSKSVTTKGKYARTSDSLVQLRLDEEQRSNLIQSSPNQEKVSKLVLTNENVHKTANSLHTHTSNFNLVSTEQETKSIIIRNEPSKLNTKQAVSDIIVKDGSVDLIHLDKTSLQKVVPLNSSFRKSIAATGEREVFTVASNGEMLHSRRGGRSVVRSSELTRSVESPENIVRLPVVPSDIQIQDNSTQIVSDVADIDSGNVSSAIVAIIQGEDGSTKTVQTVELSPEAAYEMNLPHIVKENYPSFQSSPSSSQGNGRSDVLPTQEGNSENKFISGKKNGKDSVTMSIQSQSYGTEGQAHVVDGDSPDNFRESEPFILIPEYSDSGNISMLHIRGCDSSTQDDADNVSLSGMEVDNTHINTTIEKPVETSQVFVPLGPNVKKINVSSNTQHYAKRSALKTKPIDWKNITSKCRTLPKIPGSTYLRGIAKKAKYKNLTSILNMKNLNLMSEELGKDVPKETNKPECDYISLPKVSAATSKGISSSILTPASTGHYSINSSLLHSSSALVQNVQIDPPSKPQSKESPVEKMEFSSDLPLYQSSDTVYASDKSESNSALPTHIEPCSSQALTIRVSTGPIHSHDATSITTSSFSTAAPSIKCADSTDTLSSRNQMVQDSHSLTSIVYCSSGEDDTPFTVHLPGGDNTKPLGSSENPIQLVQQGNTFQALQPVQEKQLEQITSLLQQRRITAPPTTHHDEIYDPKTNMKIVYKVVYPEDILPNEANDDDDEEDGDRDEDMWGGTSCLEDFQEEKRRGRKLKEWKKSKPSENDVDVDIEALEEKDDMIKQISRTRSGRISRPPRHMMKDFKHLHPINFNDDDKARDAPSIGYSDYEDPQHTILEEKPVMLEKPQRKKRPVPPITRLRYTCLTCGKLYMGKIEAHYRKFPDHRREHPLSPHEPQQSYSAIKALSESVKPTSEEGGEVNKSVLSPIPGTQASETNSEPSLPMETLTTQPVENESGIISEEPTSHISTTEMPEELPTVQPSRGRGRGRGRRGRFGRGRGRKRNTAGRRRKASPSTAASPTVTPIPSHVNMLEMVLSGYSSEDILKAVGKRLFENLSTWQVMCFQTREKDNDDKLQTWKERLHCLEDLLKNFKIEFEQDMEITQELPPQSGVAKEGLKYSSANYGEGKKKKARIGVFEDLGTGPRNIKTESSEREEMKIITFEDLDMSNDKVTTKVLENINDLKVSHDLADAIGICSGIYKVKELSKGESQNVLCTTENSTSDPTKVNGPHLPSASERKPLCLTEERKEANVNSAKRPKLDYDIEKDTSQKKGISTRPSSVRGSDSLKMECDIFLSKTKESLGVDSISKALEDTSSDIDLSHLNLPSPISSESSLVQSQLQTSIAPTSILPTTEGTSTVLPTSLSASHLNLATSNENMPKHTNLTARLPSTCTSHTPVVTTIASASSLPVEVSPFTTHNNSVSSISTCIQLPNMDAPLITTSSLPQVSTMPLGDLDITAEDLPRLLSEGTGLVVGSGSDGGDACDAPKLLDTSGDTTDLSEMLFKLQEATAGISQSQHSNIETPAYQEPVMTSTSQINVSSSQLITSQCFTTQAVTTLASQGFSTLGQTVTTQPATSHDLKQVSTQGTTHTSMPLLTTFTGALNATSDYRSRSPSTDQTTNSASENNSDMHQVPITQIDSQTSAIRMDQSKPDICNDRGKLNLGFAVSEFEDLLKR